MEEAVYPIDQRTSAQRLAAEVDSLVNRFCQQDKYLPTDDHMEAVIPVTDVADCVWLLPRKTTDEWTSADVL